LPCLKRRESSGSERCPINRVTCRR
jgi:hypothetical protein